MRLLVTPATPYGRLVRIVLHERGLRDAIDVEFVRTRVPNCVVNEHNPTGKVPTLVTDDGHGLCEAKLIVQYLDTLHGGAPVLGTPPSPDAAALEGVLTGFVDGIAVWVRELVRAEDERSPNILRQEQARAKRCLDWLDPRVEDIDAASRYVQLLCFVALEALDHGNKLADWRERAPRLAAWYASAEEAPAVVALRSKQV